MKTLFLSTGLLLTLAVPAAAQHAFEGEWALDCANRTGDMVPTVIGDGKITYYASTCTIDRVEQIGEWQQAWKVSITCQGEGPKWTRNLLLALDRDFDGNPRQLIEVGLDDGFVVARFLCE